MSRAFWPFLLKISKPLNTSVKKLTPGDIFGRMSQAFWPFGVAPLPLPTLGAGIQGSAAVALASKLLVSFCYYLLLLVIIGYY